jgi:tetratricopeptide (TPR) repeat protein
VKRRCRLLCLLSLLAFSAPGFDNAAYGASRAESASASAAEGKCDDAAAEAAAVAEQDPGAVDALIAAARCYARLNKPSRAVPLLEKALAVNPENEDAVTGLAAALLNAGERDKAEGLLTGLLDKKADSDEALALLVFLAGQAGDSATAEKYLKKRLDQEPDNENLLFRLGDFYLESGAADKAVALLEARLETRPEAQAVRGRLAGLLASSGKAEQALALLDKAPKQDGAIKLAKAGILLRVGRLDEGEATLKSLLEDPRDRAWADEARIGLTELYMQTGRAKEAEKQADALTAANPGRPEGYRIRGRIRYAAKNFAGAAADFETVVKAVPDDYGTALSLAEALSAAGNSQAAENTVTRVLSDAPHFAAAYLTLADIYLKRNMPDAALMTLDMGGRAAPADTSIPMAASAVLSQLQRYGEAIKMLERPAENKNPQVAETALLRIAALYTAQKNIPKAVAAYDRLLALNPASTIAAEGRIRAQIGAKQQKAALAFAEKRQKERPDDAAAAFMTGECAVAAGDARKAEKAYLRALDIAPSWEQPLLMLVRIYGATKRADKAVKLCSDLYAKHPDNLNAAMYAAMILEQSGKFSEAETRYRKLIADRPEYLAAANNLAFLLTRHKPAPERLEEAEELAGKAAAGGASQPLDTLGWVRMLRGNAAGAEESLRKALAAKQDNTFARYHLAEVLAATGDESKKKEAVELLKAPAADKAFPQRADAEKLLKRLRGAAPGAAAQTKPTQNKPAQAKPAQSKPAQQKPAQNKPAQKKPAANKGVAASG